MSRFVLIFSIFFLFSCASLVRETKKLLEISSKVSVDYSKLDIESRINLSSYNEVKGAEIYRVELSFSPILGSSKTAFSVNVILDQKDVEFFIPGVWIKGNKFSLSKPYSPLKSKRWIFREDRLPVPLVMSYSSSDGKVFAVLKIPGKFDKSYDPDTPGSLLYDTDICGLGFDQDLGKIIITFPAEEYPIIYRRKILNAYYEIQSKETKAYVNSERRITFFIIIFSSPSFSEAITRMWKISYDIYKKEGLIQHPINLSFSDILSSVQEYFRRYFFDGPISGFYSFVETKTGKVFTNFIEGSFTGMAVFNGANSIFLGYKYGQQDLIQKGRKVINSWIENGRENGFFWDCFDPSTNQRCDLRPFFFKDSFFGRRNFETLLALYLAYKYEYDQSLKERWLSVFLEGVSAALKLQNQDGSFSRRYDFSGVPIEKQPSGTYFAVPVLLKAYEESGEQKFLSSAISAGNFINDMVEKYEYFGSTIDANSEDKEASMWAFISCYLLFKSQKEEKFRTCAEKSLYASLFWFFLWNVPFSPEQDFYKIGLNTLGLSSVSVENIHVDVYLFFFPRIVRDFADLLPEEDAARIKALSDIMIYAAMNVVPTFSNPKGTVLGIVPEVIQQTWWDYGLGGKGIYNGKGTYNITSATGWTVASIVSAMKNYFISSDF